MQALALGFVREGICPGVFARAGGETNPPGGVFDRFGGSHRINRHFPDSLQVWGNYTPAPFVEGTEISPQSSDDLIPRFSCARAAAYTYFPSSRCTSPVIFTLPSIAPVYAGAGLRRRSSISLRIFRMCLTVGHRFRSITLKLHLFLYLREKVG